LRILRHTDVAIVGGGIAGATAAAMLGRAGIDAVLIDPHTVYPPDFRCEKLDHSQIRLLHKTGLGEAVLPTTTHNDGVWVARMGRLVDRKPDNQYGFFYGTLVNSVRHEIPPAVPFIASKVKTISTSVDRQSIKLLNGEEISARLVVYASGLNTKLCRALGMEREILSPCHSISIGFSLKPAGGGSFKFPALTYYPERAGDRIAYLSLFPIGSAMRANLFVYWDRHDPRLSEMRKAPEQALFAAMPGLRQLTGDIEITEGVSIRPVDLSVAKRHRQAGIVLVGDAYSTSCPAAGTGVNKVFTDVERLCNVHIPQWLASEGMGEDKISTFYDDDVKARCERYCFHKAHYVRSISADPGLSWQARRWAKFLLQLGKGAFRRGRVPPCQPTQADQPAGSGVSEANAASGVEFTRDIAGFKALEADWRALFERSKTQHYFLSYDWCKIWWDFFGEPAGWQPVVITVRREGQLAALLPLAVRRTGQHGLAEAMGDETGQYSDMLVAPDTKLDQDLFDQLWDGILAAGIDRMVFNNVLDDSALARFLMPRRTIRSDSKIACCLDTGAYGDFDAYMKTRAASLRKSIRRRRRRLEALGPVVFENVTDPDQLEDILRANVGHKRDRLADRGLHGRFLSRPDIVAWMAKLARAALETGHFHLSVLRVGDRVVSAQYGFICGGTMTAYMTSFDLEYRPYSVGTMQVHGFIEQLFDRGLKIDLMPPDDDYKLDWADRGTPARAYTVPVTHLGALEALIFNSRSRTAIKTIYHSLPSSIRAGVAAAGFHAIGAMRALIRKRSSN
jgi:CelD/BcsL family acetyltransferase involved in cellulose biosynthesis/flavin-dependent dehydrogenase